MVDNEQYKALRKAKKLAEIKLYEYIDKCR